MAAALKLRSHDDETSSNEKQTRDSPRVQEARVLVSLGKSKMVATSCLEHEISSVMSSIPIIPTVVADGEISRKCWCSRRWDE